MASKIYDSFLDDVLNNNIDVAGDTFKMMLCTSSYTPNQGTHAKRSSVTNEVSGTGYTAGGAAVGLTIAKDGTNHKNTIQPAAVTWNTATITARYGVIYKSRGGASSADELVCVIDFGGDVTSTAAAFVATTSPALTYQN